MCRPTWSRHLEPIVGYTEDVVKPCFENLWKHYTETFPTPDGVSEV